MKDLLVLQQVELLKDHRIILCGEDDSINRLADLLLSGSGWDIVRAKTVEEACDAASDTEPWFVVSIECLPQWDALVEKAKEKDWKMSTTAIVLDSIYLNRKNEVFSEEYRNTIEDFFLEIRKKAIVFGFLKISEKFLDDSGISKFSDGPTAFAYGYAKVGTSTIQASLAALGYPDIDIHMIRGDKILHYLKSKESVKLFCGVREPIITELSLFFQAYLSQRFNGTKESFNDKFENRFADSYLNGKVLFENEPSEYGMLFGWFDKELKRNFGIDIFSQTFDRERGFSIYKKDNIEAFVYKLEKLDTLEKEIAKFLGNPSFKLIRANTTAEKNVEFLYKEAKESMVISRQYLDFFYKDNERMDFFYTPEEKKAFLQELEKHVAK